MLGPIPFARFTFDRAPGQVIFIINESKTFHMRLGFDRGWRLKKVRARKGPNRGCLNESDRKISGSHMPRAAIESCIGLGWGRSSDGEEAGRASDEAGSNGAAQMTEDRRFHEFVSVGRMLAGPGICVQPRR